MLKLKFFDVQLGNATLIQTDNTNILFDIGCNSTLDEHPLFSFEGNLDYLIITHPHEDHITGLVDIDSKRPRVFGRNGRIPLNLIEERIASTDNESAIEAYEKYLELTADYKFPVNPLNDPENPSYNGHLEIYSFAPSGNIKDLNYYSIATILKYECNTILLMGDNTPSNIQELLEFEDFFNKTTDIDILLAPHHGRDSSYSVEFLNHLNPQITIISDESGKDNVSASDKYGSKSRGYKVHKNNELIERKCLTTRNDGTIEAVINGGELEIYCEK